MLLEEIERLKAAIAQKHGCGSHFLESMTIEEMFRGRIVWQGEVCVFALLNHPKAPKCFAWSHRYGPSEYDERFYVVLQQGVVKTARDAVKLAMIADANKGD